MLRTHTCGELRLENDKTEVTLAGWNDSRRDHGGVIFIDLRDRYGLTQVVFEPKHAPDAHRLAESMRREDVIQVKGKVRPRGPDLENPKMVTGQIEILVDGAKILNKAETPPLEVDDNKPACEDMRLKFRYLDLRRPSMQKKFLIRHNAMQAARKYLNANGFLELETPILVKSTPEGARDYVVPSRTNPGKFFSLPQSPQLYKQVFMYSGFDKYYQFARCFRDEDLRTDRQPEHTQIDLEMSFVELEDLWQMWEGLLKAAFKGGINYDVKTPFTRLSYMESMNRYGSDKPDLRFALELTDLTDMMKESSFSVFAGAAQSGGFVKCICPDKDFSRKEIDELTAFAQRFGAKGLAWMKVRENNVLEGSVVKFFKEEEQKQILELTKAKPGSTILFMADKFDVCHDVLGRLRNKLGKELQLYDPKEFVFSIVSDFPLFEWNEDENRWDAMHHMFCQPKEEHIDMLEKDPGNVLCTQYDIALNGSELGSGSIRISNPKLQERVLNVVGYSQERAWAAFGFLMEAMKYGSPPHGGIGLGFDRICALMCGTNDIREVITFPKTKSQECPMDGSPSPLDRAQLKELHLKHDLPEKK
ncbi:MAG: aspartate--tRNA ligase [Candidatus Nanoarchaeia archaeon]